MASPGSVALVHVDGDSLHAEWLRGIVGEFPEIRHRAHLRRRADAISCCRNEPPDILVTEIILPDGDGLGIARELRERQIIPRVLVFTASADDWTLYRLGKETIHGIVWKTANSAGEMRSALREILSGRRYFPAGAAAAFDRLRHDPEAFFKILSGQEITLMPMFARGLTDTEVAGSASLARATVRGHRHNLMRKIGIHSYAQLVCWCIAKGFLPVAPPDLPFDGVEPHTEQSRLNAAFLASQEKKTVRSD